MSLIKWIIISSIITLPFMFLLPSDNLSDQDAEKILAGFQFNDVCSNALAQGCPLDAFKPVYNQCTKVYGNISLEQCKSKCCNATQNSSDFMGGLIPKVP